MFLKILKGQEFRSYFKIYLIDNVPARFSNDTSDADRINISGRYGQFFPIGSTIKLFSMENPSIVGQYVVSDCNENTTTNKTEVDLTGFSNTTEFFGVSQKVNQSINSLSTSTITGTLREGNAEIVVFDYATWDGQAALTLLASDTENLVVNTRPYYLDIEIEFNPNVPDYTVNDINISYVFTGNYRFVMADGYNTYSDIFSIDSRLGTTSALKRKAFIPRIPVYVQDYNKGELG